MKSNYPKFDILHNGLKRICKETLESYLDTNMQYISEETSKRLPISSGIFFDGDFKGKIFVSFDYDCASKIAYSLLKEDILSINNDKEKRSIYLGWELCNIVAGNIASFLYKNGIDISPKQRVFGVYDDQKHFGRIKKHFKYLFENKLIQVTFLVH